jgi:hypothetical protein
MRLSEWRVKAPFKDSTSPKVLAVVEQAIVPLGADPDPECWIAWGDDPAARYLIYVPTPSGLIQANVRVAVPGEGPRASAKVLRWNRIQLGELAIEIQGGHRLVTFQVENQVLNGADAFADAIAAFAQTLFAAVDGRTLAPPRKSAGATKARPTAKPAARATRPPVKKGRAT